MGITLQKIVGAILFALILVVGLNLLVNAIMPLRTEPPPANVASSEGGMEAQPEQAKAAGGGAPASQEQPLPQRLAAADAGKGQADIKVCQSCHNFAEGAGAKVGPDLYGVVGRQKASVPGFAYSDALKKLGGTWTYEDLDQFLSKPSALAPGTKMTFAGLAEGDKRADVLAYLKSISPDAPPLPK